jgi:hypothetical protein
MQTVDNNWQQLKEEDRSVPEKQPHKMLDAEDIFVVEWTNNTEQQKITWRDRMVPYTAWIDKGRDLGMWRACENRLYEEIQADLAINSFGQGYRVIKSSARFEDGTSMLNVKVIEIQQYTEIKELLLILDGVRIFVGQRGRIKNGSRWRFDTSVPIKDFV